MKTSRSVRVVIGEECAYVGILNFEVDGRKQVSSFRYADEWLERPDSFALAPLLPLNNPVSFHSGIAGNTRDALPGPIADCAPDSWGRRLIAQNLGYAANELEALLAVNDRSRQGALRFLDENGVSLSSSLPAVRTANLEDLRSLVQKFENNEGDLHQIAQALRGSGDSLGGARPKCDFEDLGVLYLAKFTSFNDTMAIERMETATLSLAASVGLRAASARLELKTSKWPVALIERFDRAGTNRRYYVSARTFVGNEPDDEAFYTDLVDVMRGYCGGGEAMLGELRELYRRILFTILVSNNDDHLKNHGFLYAGDGAWKLSPAFDINPQPDRHRQLKTGISELSGYSASIEAAIESAPFFELSEEAARAEALRMAEQICREWRHHCTNAGMSRDECAVYAPAFNHPEMQYALTLNISLPFLCHTG